MKIDLTVPVREDLWHDVFKNEQMASLGHLGTHFDVRDKTFNLENTHRTGKVVDVRHVRERDIEVADLAELHIEAQDFIMLHTGFLKEAGYGGKVYFKDHPQLSMALIDHLLDKKVSLIGLDAAGIRRGEEHSKTDQYCADRGVFIIENLDNLDILQAQVAGKSFTVYTFPINFEGMSGLPCRVVAEISELRSSSCRSALALDQGKY